MRLALLPLLALATVGSAAEGPERPSVEVGGFALRPMANLTYRDDTVEMHPKALVGLGYNSNVRAQENGDGDVFYRVVAGVESRWYLTPSSALVADGEIEQLDYVDENEFDLVGGRGSLEHVWQGERWQTNLTGRFARTQEPLVQTGEQIDHDDIEGLAEVAYTSLRSHIVAGVSAQREDFLDDSRLFDDRERDSNRYGVGVRFGRITARDSELFARTRVMATVYDQSTVYRDNRGVVALVGYSGRAGTRSTFLAEGGIEYRRYDAGFGADEGGRTAVRPAGTLRLLWPWETGSQIEAGVFSELRDSLTSNALWLYGGSVEGRYRLRTNMRVFGAVRVFESEDVEPPAGTESDQRITAQLEAGAEYFLREGIGIRLRTSYSDSDANNEADYDRLLAALEFAVVF
jgi:hypothetical protein